MGLSPIIVFCYNRPWHVEKTLLALSKNELADQSELFVFCDGPKKDATKEQLERIEETRCVVKKKRWCKDVHIIESDINKGLRSSIISGVDQVIRQYGKVIVLEDDLETSPYFLKYMNAALSKYQNYGGVFSISAQSYVNPNDFPKDYPYDVYAYPTHLPTGWATWIDRWNVVNWDIDKQLAEQFEKEPYMRDAFMRGGEDLYYQSLRERLNGLDVWSVCFSLAHFKHHAVSILPVVSYIHNTGFDGSGVNSGHQETSMLNHNYYVDAKDNPRLLDVVYEDRRIVNLVYSSSVMHRRPFIKRIINRIGCIVTKKSNFILKGEVYKL